MRPNCFMMLLQTLSCRKLCVHMSWETLDGCYSRPFCP